jgi:SAM-dependent methyltransferase
MTPLLLSYLCEPTTHLSLTLLNAQYDDEGNIDSGLLVTDEGASYPIIDGIPRFIPLEATNSVTSFGDEWNYFNFTDFKENWLTQTVASTFGNTAVFEDKLIVDAGGGSGSQSKWFSEYGAKHVILLELSHSVDSIIRKNLIGISNVDVIQCSIDSPPIKPGSIDGIVYCHNVIQHTESVEKTAGALFDLVAPGGEFVFNCYELGDKGMRKWMRWHLVYMPLRKFLSKRSFTTVLAYARTAAALRLLPGFGFLFEKAGFCITGTVVIPDALSVPRRLKLRYKATSLNTYDLFGSHSNQHHKTELEIRELVQVLQPDPTKILNQENYFLKPQPIGCALRVFR